MTDEQRADLAAVEAPTVVPVEAAGEGVIDGFDELDDDATVVRPVNLDSDTDATVVRVRPPVSPADADGDVDPDATVVRAVPAATGTGTVALEAQSAPGEMDSDAEATVVRPRPTPERRGPDYRGDPVPDPEHAVGKFAQQAVSSGAPAETEPARLLRRAANFMPRVYAPRRVATELAPEPVATAAGGVAAENPRAQLPSIARRDRRRRVITLAGYAASVGVAIAGLWFVATLAFAS